MEWKKKSRVVCFSTFTQNTYVYYITLWFLIYSSLQYKKKISAVLFPRACSKTLICINIREKEKISERFPEKTFFFCFDFLTKVLRNSVCLWKVVLCFDDCSSSSRNWIFQLISRWDSDACWPIQARTRWEKREGNRHCFWGIGNGGVK